jgi:hypothetical protein
MHNERVRIQVLAYCGDRFRFVHNRWWVYDVDTGFWTRRQARERLFQATWNVWRDLEKNQPPMTYLVNRVIIRMTDDLWDDALPGRPTRDLYRNRSSEPPTGPPEPGPAPANPPETPNPAR